jgi:branched-chain amino acid transport system permease protein
MGFDALVYLIVGGIGSIVGTILGPAIMILISELLQTVVEIRLFIDGLALIILIIFMPQGIVGGVAYLRKKLFQGRGKTTNGFPGVNDITIKRYNEKQKFHISF